ncbi:MAG: hypothetical protein IPI83_05845 [Sphingomonadales bacterium]|nr:hypothetical protein [Sphingomonadales bacterium]
MKVSVKNGQIILVDDVGAEIRTGRGDYGAPRALDGQRSTSRLGAKFVLCFSEDLGPRERLVANRSTSPAMRIAAMLPFPPYPTPFALDDELYGSVEGFWQSLKCESVARRRQVAALSGIDAKKAAGKGAPCCKT